MNEHRYVAVEGGKFHQPLPHAANENHRPWRDVLLMKCGRSLVPTNYFATREDALHYCGARQEYLCQQCERR